MILKHAQAQQIFVYMLTIIVVGLILLMGGKYILNIVGQMKQVDLVKFKTTLEQEAATYHNYGRWKNLELPVPSEVKEVCFVDLKQADQASTSDLCTTRSKLLCDAWKDKTQNVLTDPFVVDTPVNIGDITPYNKTANSALPSLCLPVVGGVLKVKFVGGARGTLEVSEW